MKIGCAVLAGGKSSRMGTDKALLELNGETFMQMLCREFDDFEEKMIARGNRSEIPEVSWSCISDIYVNRGPIGGLHAVLSQMESDAVFCISCDMPLLQKSLVSLLFQYMKEGIDAVIAVTEDGRKHPLCGIYRKSVVGILEKQILSGNNRMMAALEQMQVTYVTILDADSRQLKNINTPEDYSAIQ